MDRKKDKHSWTHSRTPVREGTERKERECVCVCVRADEWHGKKEMFLACKCVCVLICFVEFYFYWMRRFSIFRSLFSVSFCLTLPFCRIYSSFGGVFSFLLLFFSPLIYEEHSTRMTYPWYYLWLNNNIVIFLYLFVDQSNVYIMCVYFVSVFSLIIIVVVGNSLLYPTNADLITRRFQWINMHLSRNKDCTQNIHWKRAKRKMKTKEKQ